MVEFRDKRVVTVVGGSGFLGKYVVRRLAQEDYAVRVLCRHPDAAGHLRVAGNVGQIAVEYADLVKPESFAAHLAGSYAVVNLVGVLFESGQQKFSSVHTQGASALAQAAKACGVQRFVQISALGADQSQSAYARSKLAGEQAVRAVFPEAIILRPSVLFGPEDDFFNKFAKMATLGHALPNIGGGKTRFQPVYVADVAAAVAACLEREDAPGQTYELGGPEVYSFLQILELVKREIGRKAFVVNLPFGLASMVGAVSELSPFAPVLTRDQVTSLKTDNVVQPGAKTLADLGVAPTDAELVIPDYLVRFRPGGRKENLAH